MPPKKSKTVAQQCDICCQAIDLKRGDAIFCHGDCQRWIHRFCASVSMEQHKIITASQTTTPFLCPTCCRAAHQKKISELTDSVTTLKEEVSELKKALLTVTNDLTCLREVQQPVTSDVSRKRVKDNSNRVLRTIKTAQSSTVSNKRQGPVSRTNAKLGALQRQRSTVVGVRRVWGTMKSTTPTAVSSTLKKLTTVGGSLFVKRKSKVHESSGKTRWWFVLKGDEEILKDLEGEWTNVHLQTNWKLETCTKPTDATDANASASNVVTENIVHQHVAVHQHLSPPSNPVLQSSHNHNDNPAAEVSPQTVTDQHVSVNSSVDLSQTTDHGQVESDIESPSYSSTNSNPSSSLSSFLDPK